MIIKKQVDLSNQPATILTPHVIVVQHLDHNRRTL